MKIYKRNIVQQEIETDGSFCQASFNSDGHITLRTYGGGPGANGDTIVSLSDVETKAIFDLFKKFTKQMNDREIELPF